MVKHAPPPEAADPQLNVEALLARLEEAESTLSAIRDGHVEALVVSSHEGPKVYALEGAEHRYRRLVETMSEGALLVSAGGVVLYSNAAFADMVSVPLERVIGRPVQIIWPLDRFAAVAPPQPAAPTTTTNGQ